jgi:hypothetical protein
MTANTGRTVFKFTTFEIDSTVPTFTAIPLVGLSVVGLVYDEVDLTTWADAVKMALPGQPDAPVEIQTMFDNTATSGSHVVLSALAGLMTPLSLAIKFGIRHAWEAGEPVFGITSTAANGYWCSRYSVDPATGIATARFLVLPGSAIPAWGTSAIT